MPYAGNQGPSDGGACASAARLCRFGGQTWLIALSYAETLRTTVLSLPDRLLPFGRAHDSLPLTGKHLDDLGCLGIFRLVKFAEAP